VTTLLLVRHGETDWNRDHRWQGHSDPPLNERGREQARDLATTLDAADVVYASDLERARATAEILAERLAVPLRLDVRLRERNFGAWEGLTSAEIEEQQGESFLRWRNGDGHGAEDAEPYAEFFARVKSFVDEAVERHPGQTILVVAHGGSVRAVLALAEGIDFVSGHASIPSVANCSVSRCAVREGKLARLD
jgi:probable phosphoglycerate mutase